MKQRKGARPIRVDGDEAFIALTQGKVCVIDATDIGRFEGRNWHAHKDKRGNFYARRSIRAAGKKTYIYAHHVVAGPVPEGYVPHHLDGDGLNNRRSNLEVITSGANLALAQRKGVPTRKLKPRRARRLEPIERRSGSVRYVKRDKTWSAQIYLGKYRTRVEADAARAWAASALQAYSALWRCTLADGPGTAGERTALS